MSQVFFTAQSLSYICSIQINFLMTDIFISNLNAAGKEEAAQNAKQTRFAGLLAEAAAILGDTPMVISAWPDSGVGPDCTANYMQYLIDQKSERRSTAITTSNVTGNQPQVMLPVPDPEAFASEDIKAVILPDVKGYEGNVQGAMPLICEVFSRDTASKNPLVRPINGKPSSDESVKLMPPVPKGSKIFILNAVPQLPEKISPANVFIIDSACPALRADAKRGDVFVYSAGFYKCYSFEEKCAAIQRQPQKLVPVPSLESQETARAFIVSDLNLEDMMQKTGVKSMYVLLMEDAKAGEASYEQGTFLFAELDGDLKFSEVPFDLFFR